MDHITRQAIKNPLIYRENNTQNNIFEMEYTPKHNKKKDGRVAKGKPANKVEKIFSTKKHAYCCNNPFVTKVKKSDEVSRRNFVKLKLNKVHENILAKDEEDRRSFILLHMQTLYRNVLNRRGNIRSNTYI